MNWSFLISVLTLAGIIGIPTLVHWDWTGRKAPLISSYYRVLLHLMSGIGMVFAFIAALILACALYDQLTHVGWGYPVWVDPLLLAMIAVGIAINRAIRSYLRWNKSAAPNSL
jgi:hypothetical protein